MHHPKLLGLASLATVLLTALPAWAPPPADETNPIVSWELDAIEAAAERLLLNEALELIREKNYTFAVARLVPLTKSRFLPDAVVKSIPRSIEDLHHLIAVTSIAAIGKEHDAKIPSVNTEQLSSAIKRPLLWAELLQAVEVLMETPLSNGAKLPWTAPQANKLLNAVAEEFGPETAGKLRVELSAKLFLMGQSNNANELIERETPNEHAREVLADLRTIILGSGTLVNPQVARFVPVNGLKELPGVVPLVPTDSLDKWKRPSPPSETETTLEKLAKRVRKEMIAESGAEADRLSRRVTATTNGIRAELAKKVGPHTDK